MNLGALVITTLRECKIKKEDDYFSWGSKLVKIKHIRNRNTSK